MQDQVSMSLFSLQTTFSVVKYLQNVYIYQVKNPMKTVQIYPVLASYLYGPCADKLSFLSDIFENRSVFKFVNFVKSKILIAK